MTARISRTRAALAAALCAIALGAQPVAAAESESAPKPARPGAKLTLMKHDGTYSSTPSEASFALLTCNPPGGTHPSSQAACKSLRSSGGNIQKLAENPEAICNKLYRPVTVHAYGQWNGRHVNQWRTFSNSCEAEAATATVFTF
ncbi:SSI family serine proteinase inhibitor [Streptomyces cavernicola]|uniref:SSI family serine proteinase inhibitor n=1 Tax=Streptomyces cavernicola TaxID=3043613 RepID=A0ABT6S6U7_9ACTN|nr:SSI family serine proteinase inhibitor [Streptomyces sp. B-S-A6]MDI3403817.1 SSI family serine proteinase inhibitor [Streptomyces sp. B-S-A6]